MIADPDPVPEDEFTARLLACDEALATGTVPIHVSDGASPELRTRLERGLACVQLLQRLRPRPAAENGAADKTSILLPSHAALPPGGDDVPTPVQIGRFQIRRTLGAGGFGIVYLAYDPALCREVALKIPRAEALADSECMARFQREARAAAGLDHPNLVPVHEAGQLGPVCYIALAYCPGYNLAEWLKLRKVPVGCVQAAELLLTLAQAVHYAHEHGVLHRDLKPSNILLSPGALAQWPSRTSLSTGAGANGLWLPDAEVGFIPRITDFGLARFTVGDQAQTQTGAVLGTPCYMAPEQASGQMKEVGPATDVYSLGSILYEVATGRPPFWGASSAATLWEVKSAEPVAPSRLRPEMPRDLETICLKCLHKEPRRRYESVATLAEDLRRFLGGRPILARPTGRTEQVLKWARRRPGLASALGALVFVTLLGIGGILRQWQQTQDALADEATARRQAVFLQVQAEQAQQAEAGARENSEVALYHHRVVLAHREWSAGNVGRASQLLDECRVDLRDWEWRHVRRLCDHDLFTLRGHSAPVTTIVFSPDGRQLASVSGHWFTSDPGEVKLWDAMTGQLLWTGLGHTGPVMGVAFSPDGRHLASTSVAWDMKGEIKIWETATGVAVQTLAVPPGGAFTVAYSPDGMLLASGGADFMVRLWDPKTGKQVSVFKDHTNNIFSVGFSPDGRLLASAGWEGKARVWDVADGKPIRILSGPVDLRSVEFSPDGRHLVTASYDQSAKIWDATSGQLLRTYWGHSAALSRATFSPDGRWVASADTAGDVQVWNAQSGRLFRTVRGHTGTVGCVAFSPEGRRLATAGVDRIVRIWDFTREQEAYPLDQTGPTRNVVFSPDGKFLAASGYLHSSGVRLEKRVRVWSVEDFSRPRIWEGHTDWVSCVAFHPEGKLLASGNNDKSIRLWDVATGKAAHRLVGHNGMVTGVSFSPDGHRLASASLDKTVKLWDVTSGRPLAPLLAHPQPVHDVVFLHKGHRLVSVGDCGLVRVWDVETGTAVFDLRGHRDAVERVVLSPDGNLLATAGRDRTVRIWDMTTDPADGQDAVPLKILVGPLETERVTGLSFTPDGRRLASSGRDHTIRIWDVASGNETLTLRGHLDYVTGLSFSPDGRLLASASTRNITIWDAGVGTPCGHSGNAELAEREAVAWHRQQANDCQSANPPEWYGVAFHVSRLLESSPADVRLRSRRVRAEVELGQWPSAVDDCTRCIAEGATDPRFWLVQALGRLQLGDTDGYRSSCADMIERFGRSAPPEWANNIAWVCALAPAAIPNLDRAVDLATKATTATPTSSAYHNILGAIQYRAGRFDAAKTSLHEAMRLSKGDDPEDWLFLAMTYHRLGDSGEARIWLDKAIRWCEAARTRKVSSGDAPQASVARLTELDLLRREAEALLTGNLQRTGLPSGTNGPQFNVGARP